MLYNADDAGGQRIYEPTLFYGGEAMDTGSFGAAGDRPRSGATGPRFLVERRSVPTAGAPAAGARSGPLKEILEAHRVEISRRWIAKGTHLSHACQASENVYFLDGGWICLYSVLRSGRRQIVDLLIDDGAIGLDWEGGPAPSHAAQALTDCRVAVVRKRALLHLAASSPAVAVHVAVTTCRGSMAAHYRLANIYARSAIERVAFVLLDLFVRVQSRMPVFRGEEALLPITQEDLSDMLGLTVVHVNRMLRTLREAKVIRFRAGRLQVLDPDRLAEIAEYDANVAQHA